MVLCQGEAATLIVPATLTVAATVTVAALALSLLGRRGTNRTGSLHRQILTDRTKPQSFQRYKMPHLWNALAMLCIPHTAYLKMKQLLGYILLSYRAPIMSSCARKGIHISKSSAAYVTIECSLKTHAASPNEPLWQYNMNCVAVNYRVCDCQLIILEVWK